MLGDVKFYKINQQNFILYVYYREKLGNLNKLVMREGIDVYFDKTNQQNWCVLQRKIKEFKE